MSFPFDVVHVSIVVQGCEEGWHVLMRRYYFHCSRLEQRKLALKFPDYV